MSKENGEKNARRLMELAEDRYLEEAAEGLVRKKSSWKRWTALAACVCLVIAGGAGLGMQWWNSLNQDLPAEGQVDILQPGQEDQMQEGSGLWVPAMELPEMSEGMAADMIACVVYKGGIYAQFTDVYVDDDAERIRDLLGEKLGYAKGNLDEWSTQDEYAEEFAGSVNGNVYAVKGYDTSFRIAIANERRIMFLERMNGIAVNTGADVFEERLHLSGNWESIAWLDQDTWYHDEEGPAEPVSVEIPSDVWEMFLTEINEGQFEYLWSEDISEVKDEQGRTIYDRIAVHLFVTMQDGTVNQFRISEDGYVLYEGLLWYGVKISSETLSAVLDTML